MPHIHELYDFTVGIYIVHDGKVLLVNHPRYGQWLSPGGHIELDEDPEQALFREIKEETGLEVEILSDKPDVQSKTGKFLPTPNYLDVHDANPPHKHINLIYFAKAKDGNFVLSKEHEAMKWFTLDEIKQYGDKIGKGSLFCAEQAIKTATEWEEK